MVKNFTLLQKIYFCSKFELSIFPRIVKETIKKCIRVFTKI